MTEMLQIGTLSVGIVRRPIKNMHLSVFPPNGRVSVSVPERTRTDLIRVFVLGKSDWIRKHQAAFEEQPREPAREYVARESHFVWGRRYLLDVVETEERAQMLLSANKLTMYVKPGSERSAREALFDKWMRDLVREAAMLLLPRFEKLVGVRVKRVFVQRMKTKWGSCNHNQQHVRLNSELAREPSSSLEYILLHEMLHLIEPTHNSRFQLLLDQYAAGWREQRQSLNSRPVRHQVW